MRKQAHSEVVYTLEELKYLFQHMKRREYRIFHPFLEELLRILQNEGLTDSKKILNVVRTRKKRAPILERHKEISRTLVKFMHKIRSFHPQKHSFKNLPDYIITGTLIKKTSREF